MPTREEMLNFIMDKCTDANDQELELYYWFFVEL